MQALEQLVQVVATLRGESSCPWDRAQTHRSLAPYLLEEVHEVLQAIEQGDQQELCTELGDLLYLVLLLVQVGADQGAFDLDRVASGVKAKMIRRHPGIFTDQARPEGLGTLASWEARKAEERQRSSRLDGVPRSLPALLRAHRTGEKAAAVGFDWSDASGPRAKVDEELAELDEARARSDQEQVRAELGDVLLALTSLARHLDVPPESALQAANDRFQARFQVMERLARERGLGLDEAGPERLNALWEEAKASGA